MGEGNSLEINEEELERKEESRSNKNYKESHNKMGNKRIKLIVLHPPVVQRAFKGKHWLFAKWASWLSYRCVTKRADGIFRLCPVFN